MQAKCQLLCLYKFELGVAMFGSVLFVIAAEGKV